MGWPEGPEAEAPPAPASAPAKGIPKPPPTAHNPISAFQEYCAKIQAPPPTYAFSKAGPDHVPTVTCTCSWQGNEVRATDSSKKRAKRKAAALALAELL